MVGKKKEARFELVLTDEEKNALERLAERDGVSMAHYLRNYIRASAMRRGVWEAE